jgi:hypothetical protein
MQFLTIRATAHVYRVSRRTSGGATGPHSPAFKSAVICSGVPGALRFGGGRVRDLAGTPFHDHLLEAARKVKVQKAGLVGVDAKAVDAVRRNIGKGVSAIVTRSSGSIE